jgi:hypothetical protein
MNHYKLKVDQSYRFKDIKTAMRILISFKLLRIINITSNKL